MLRVDQEPRFRLGSVKDSVALCLLALLILSPVIMAGNESAREDDSEVIDKIKSQLLSERAKLDSLTNIKQTELEQLNTLDNQLALTSQLLSRLNRRLRDLGEREEELSIEVSEIDSLLTRQKVRLSVSLRNFYIRRRRLPEILINPTDFDQTVSQLVYTRKSVESLKNIIRSTDSLLLTLNSNKEELEETRVQLNRYYREKDMEENFLSSERGRRNTLMDRIRKEEALYREHLTQLEDDLMASDSLFAVTKSSANNSAFESQKGNLPYPLKGKIIKSFGTHRDRKTFTDIFFPGIEIRGKLNGEIRAVYDGVVFHRGTLRGYGNVLILDHGGGWYTLYAHLSDYSVGMGDIVGTGDVIGYLGESNVEEGPSLHFQIRHKKEQYDPVEWLRH